MAGSDFSALQTKIDALTAQVKATTTVEASAKALILGQGDATKAAVAAALAADDAADAGSIAAASTAIDGVTQQFAASAADLGTAIPTNTPPVTPVQPTSAP